MKFHFYNLIMSIFYIISIKIVNKVFIVFLNM